MAVGFRRLHDELTVTADADAVQQRLVEFACAVVDHCEWAALTVWEKAGPRTAADTGVVAELITRLQYDTAEGPAVAAVGDDLVWMSNVFAETRWPAFVRAARTYTPVRSALACPVGTKRSPAVLTLYARAPRRLHFEAVNAAPLFAMHAGALLAHAGSIRESAQLAQAVTTNRQIGEAIGILMTTHNVTDETAFRMLRATSNRRNLKLRDVAQEVKSTGQLPT